MTSNANQIRKYMKLLEAEYTGPINDPRISYSHEKKKGEITKVIANLNAQPSARYTKLGNNLKRIEQMSEEIEALKAEVKQDTRELVADLFHAEDAARTRVVETVSFTFHLSKDPKASETVQYSKVLEELQDHLTPELMSVLASIKEKYTKINEPKAPSLKATDKRIQQEESIDLNEGFWDKLKGMLTKYAERVMAWGQKYDDKLAKLKAEVGMH